MFRTEPSGQQADVERIGVVHHPFVMNPLHRARHGGQELIRQAFASELFVAIEEP